MKLSSGSPLVGILFNLMGIPSLLISLYLFMHPPEPIFCYVPANGGVCPPTIDVNPFGFPLFIIGLITIGYDFDYIRS